MLLKVINIMLAIAIVEGRSPLILRENGDPELGNNTSFTTIQYIQNIH